MTRPPVIPRSGVARRHQLVIEWNDTRRHSPGEPGPAERSIPELVRSWAERTPDAPALELADEALTYGELDRRADRLARRLRGLAPGKTITRPVMFPVDRCRKPSPSSPW